MIGRREVLTKSAICATVAVFSPQAFAQGEERNGLLGGNRDNEQTALYMEALIAEAALSTIVNDDGTLVLLPGSSPSLEAQQLIQAAMSELNPEVQAGEIVITDDLGIHSAGISLRKNESGLTTYWWGIKIALNNTQTQQLVAALAGGGVVASILPGYGRAVAFVIGLGAAVVQWYAAPGTGIYIYEPFVGPSWIESQPI
jgi:hypothetical protein